MKKCKKGQIAIGVIVGIAVALIVGLLVVNVASQQIDDRTTLERQKNETVTTKVRVAALSHVPVTSIHSVDNGTLKIVNYTWTTAGTLTVTQKNQKENDTFKVSYYNEPTGYINPGTTSTILKIVPLAIALILFTFLAGFVVTKY